MLVKIRKKEDGPAAIFSASAEIGPAGLCIVINAQHKNFEVLTQGTSWLFPEHFQDEHFSMLIESEGAVAEAIFVAQTPEEAEELCRPRFDQYEKDQIVLMFIRDELLLNGTQLGHCFAEASDSAPELPDGFASVIKEAEPESVAEVMINAFGAAMVETGEDLLNMECRHPEYGDFEIVVRRKPIAEMSQKSIAKTRF